MFRTRPDQRPETVQVFVEGRALMVPEGSSAAAAILISGLSSIRETPVSGSPRMPWCMMGVCFDCLAEIDGVANRQACMVPVVAGMQIARQQRGGNALSILTVDSRVDDAVLAKVATEIDASVMKAIEVLEL
jgi:hypothetical protein